MNSGLLVIISGPSGSGKSTVKDHLLHMSDDLYFSISATTRPMKKDETDGIDYHFLSLESFRELIENDDFIEYKPYSDNYYGTLKSKIYEQLESGKHVILDIEVQGMLEIKAKYPDIVSIWLLPPNYDILSKRLYDRGREPIEEIARRLEIAKEEITHFYEYDYIVVNHDNEAKQAAMDIINIINCEKLKTKRNKTFYENFINNNNANVKE